MKKAVTFRFEADLMTEVRRCAELENRTVTNFIETLLKERVALGQADRGRGARPTAPVRMSSTQRETAARPDTAPDAP